MPPDTATGLTPNVTPFWMIGGAGAEVEVDTETGHVRVTRLVNVADVRPPINPRIVETQLSGAAIMQLGFTHVREDGVRRRPGDQRLARRLQDPRHPRHSADMENEAVDAEQRNGPFGAKGVGEIGTFGVSPAIANAIDDAVGVRLTELPLTPEAVLRALRASARHARSRTTE